MLELKRLELSDSRLKKKQEKIEKAGEAQKKKWLSKEERIKDDAKGICAYTGAPLNSEGEVDHIIPRSKTIKNYSSNFLILKLISFSYPDREMRLKRKISTSLNNSIPLI